MFEKYNLTIGCLNIGGSVKIKCAHNDIMKLIKNHYIFNIFAILESWSEPEESCPTIDGYADFRSERKRKCRAKLNYHILPQITY